jgi:hypothetical protein
MLYYCQYCNEKSAVRKVYLSQVLKRRIYHIYCTNKGCKGREEDRFKGIHTRHDKLDPRY